MHKITTPQSNSNDEFVFIAEWKFKNNDFIKKGDHLLSIETSKVVEEIFSDNSGYLEKLYDENSKVKVGEVVGILNDKKKLDLEKKVVSKKIIFTEKAKQLIKKHNLGEDQFSLKKIVKEKDVLEILKSENESNNNKDKDQLIILFKNKKPYHAAIYVEKLGIVDLSLLGSKVTEIKDYNFSECKCNFFEIKVKEKEQMINFFNEPAVLTDKIIKKEKSSKGWAMSAESADFILNFRNSRSKNIDDMNCIEWLVYGLELGGLDIPSEVLTAEKLFNWAKINLHTIEKKENNNFFANLY